MNEWNKIFQQHNKEAIPVMPSASDADQFGHVIWFNPTTGTIVSKWNQPSMHYTHWRKTDAPDVIGDAFEKWITEKYPGLERGLQSRFSLAEDAFRAGAAAALK